MDNKSGGGFGELLKKAMLAKTEMERVQKEAAKATAEGDAGGGMVKAVANGAGRVVSVDIDESLFTSGDKEMVQDLVVGAINVAIERAGYITAQKMQETAGSMFSGLGIPDLKSED